MSTDNEKKATPSVCLNMIVKNESKIIVRLLLSVLPIIDTYCICDTGSTDDTMAIIKDFFDKHGIAGKIVEKPFVNFAVNRTFALQAAKGMADYALLLDADMVLEIGPKFEKSKLIKDVYSMIQKDKDLSYYNTRIVSLKLNITVRTATHEYYDIPKPHTDEKLKQDFLYINDIGDGGSKADKFVRDIRLLEEELKEDPNNHRCHFYIANSYFNLGEYAKAMPYYEKRIELGGWIEEVFYSHYRLAQCHCALGDEPKMLHHYLTAFQKRPQRAETLYSLIKYYREKAEHFKAWVFYEVAKQIPHPTEDVLFIEHNVYSYLILYEYSIIAYYLGHKNISDLFFKLLRTMPVWYTQGLIDNYKFYKYVLQPATQTICFNDSFERVIKNTPLKFVASTPSIIPYRDGYGINLRYVTYTITKEGRYEHVFDSTVNRFIHCSSTFDKIDITELKGLGNDPECYNIQDVKITSVDDQLYYTGTCRDRVSGATRVCAGRYLDDAAFEYNILGTKNIASCEKNWVYSPRKGGGLRMIYKWHPLSIGDIVDNELVIDKTIETPPLFSLARGSTNGFAFNDEIWFLVHYVHIPKNEPREYFHGIVILNNDEVVKGYSKPFKFTEAPIEYALGLIVTEKKVIISHSVWDRESYVKVYPKEYIDTLIHYVKV